MENVRYFVWWKELIELNFSKNLYFHFRSRHHHMLRHVAMEVSVLVCSRYTQEDGLVESW